MRTLAPALLACLLWGCVPPPPCDPDEPGYVPGSDFTVPVRDRTDAHMAVYVVDSCEYVGSSCLTSERAVFTHKGNCRFCSAREAAKQ